MNEGERVGPDGGRYEGERIGNKQHGRGTCTRWRQLRSQHGRGTTLVCGEKYEGEWINSSRSNGTTICRYGTKYKGEYSDNQRHGHGIIHYDKAKYEGAWANNQWHGIGKYTSSGGYHGPLGGEGEWSSDHRYGRVKCKNEKEKKRRGKKRP